MAPSAINTYPEQVTSNSKINFVAHKYGNEITSREVYAKSLVQQVLKEQINRIDTDLCEPGDEDPFYVADLGEVYRQHLRWKMNLARVKPFYAVKCNPNKELIRLLAKLGTGFDCASKAEIDLVLGLGVEPDRIIYAQPCKTKSYLRHADRVGVKQMTFDNADELYKIKNNSPEAELVLRILTDDSSSLCRLSTKFGADLGTAFALLQLAKELELNIVGVSFHVGSGASDPIAFTNSIRDARELFDQAAVFGFDMKLLDIGGGFVSETFELFAKTINAALDAYFPPHIQVIGEPGRYYAANAFTLAANIIARREVGGSSMAEKAYMIYLNDGVYGNFTNIIFDHQHPVPQVLQKANADDAAVGYSIWGPTCDGIDIISQHCYLPGTLEVGDWLFFENMGAYTSCSATSFNGFTSEHAIIYVSSEPGAWALLDD